jgi:DNA-binding beta-propeller fold protein YncE
MAHDREGRMQRRWAATARILTAGLLFSPLLVMPPMQPTDSRADAAVECSIPALGGARKTGQPVWVALEGARQVARVNVRTDKVTRRLDVPGRPHNLVANESGTVAAALWAERRIVVMRKKVKPVKLGGAPHDVKMGGGRIVVANQGSHRLQLVSLRGNRRGKILLRADPHDVAIAPRGRRAWVTLEGTDDMALVDLKRKKVIRYKSTGRRPHDLLFAPDGQLWVTDWNGAFHVFSRRGRLLKSKSLGVEAHHLAFTPDRPQVWITDHGAHRVFVISTKTYKILKRIRIRGAPHHVTITSDGNKAVVADHDRGLLVVYRVATRTRIDKIAVGAAPHGVWAVSRAGGGNKQASGSSGSASCNALTSIDTPTP